MSAQGSCLRAVLLLFALLYPPATYHPLVPSAVGDSDLVRISIMNYESSDSSGEAGSGRPGSDGTHGLMSVGHGGHAAALLLLLRAYPASAAD